MPRGIKGSGPHARTKVVRTIDLTPTWSGITPALVAVLQNPDAPAEAHKTVEKELARMADLADKYVEYFRANFDPTANGNGLD
jgi:hypothetical protein